MQVNRPLRPGLACGIVVPAVDRFGQDVGAVATEAVYFLPEPRAGVNHEIL